MARGGVKPGLYSPEGLAALNRLFSAPALMAFDFDGTLAPICTDPDGVRIRPSWGALLQRINQHWPLAVISGRRLADLKHRLGFEPAFVAGNHGAESVAPSATPTTPTTSATSATSTSATSTISTISNSLDSARRLLASRCEALQALGIEVEDKGLSLAVHYRRSSRAVDAAACAAQLLATLPSALAVSHGKAVFNITVRAAPDKGDALVRAMRLCDVEQALYVGDDVNDEPAFAAAPPTSVTVRIGNPRLPTQARFALATHHQMGPLLRMLANHRPDFSTQAHAQTNPSRRATDRASQDQTSSTKSRSSWCTNR
jgi:trehalose 6-phosphate phosphatase